MKYWEIMADMLSKSDFLVAFHAKEQRSDKTHVTFHAR
jgi:hypothetical protein